MAPEITLYTKGYCPYCARAKALLNQKGIIQWTEYDLEELPGKQSEMIARSDGRRTVPQIFINGTHIGGSDDLAALDAADKLDAYLASNATR